MNRIPNVLTLARIGLTPIIISFLLTGRIYTALILAVLAALTDALDGFIARKFDAVSGLGQKLDTLADKIFFISIFLTIYFLSFVPGHVILLVLFRDIVNIGLITSTLLFFRKKLNQFPLLLSGKLTTFFQTILVAILILQMANAGNPLLIKLVQPALISTIIISFMSGVEYGVKFVRIIKS